LRKNPGMNSVMTLGVVLAVFRFDAAVAQEGYLGQDHDKWHHSFYQTLKSVLQSYRLSPHLRETGAKRERSTRHSRGMSGSGSKIDGADFGPAASGL
jgi:hypothetical protein